MSHQQQFYIDGAWVAPVTPKFLDVIDPSNEDAFEKIAMGSKADVDKAVAAARRAFSTFGLTSREARLALLRRIVEVYKKRSDDLALAVSREMGAPRGFALKEQVGIGLAHLEEMVGTLETFEFERLKRGSLVVKEPIGVVGLITPWNWPLNQITCKVGPALAAGCTMVLKPSEIAPLDAIIFAEILDEAGVPKGVFNLVNGDGPTVGQAIASHPDVDMVSFTGSTRAGILVAKAAADTVKRVHQELGGKSANILFPDVDFAVAVKKGVAGCFGNTGQSCNAPTRMFVPRDRQDEVAAFAKKASEKYRVGAADAEGTVLGPVVSKTQFDKVQNLIESGIAEGATLVTGGPGLPPGLNRGYFVRPTIFAGVTPDMRIAREEIFGPVLTVIKYADEADAVRIANDSDYGLAGSVFTRNAAHGLEIAAGVQSGTYGINMFMLDIKSPFGGMKQSGIGREFGEEGQSEYVEVQTIVSASKLPALQDRDSQ
jgi:aldehyde dehydrogenase (NAD+)